MNNFKVGDRVIRVSHLGQQPHLGWPAFTPGKAYTVSTVSAAGFLGLQELPRQDGNESPYDPSYFKLATSSALQVGDYVIAVSRSAWGFYDKDAIGRVSKIHGIDSMDVQFTAGCWNRDYVWPDGTLPVDKGNFKKHTPYAATFTDPATVSAVAKGHVPNSGLQRHSVGPIYPLVVVTWATGTEPYKHTVENLETGEQATVGGELMRFTDYATAYAVAELLTFNHTVPVTWAKRKV